MKQTKKNVVDIQKKETIRKISQETNEDVINIVLDTIALNKQAIIFVNTKRSAESVAEKISLYLKKHAAKNESYQSINEKSKPIAEEIFHALATPTHQCKKLSDVVTYGVAFHHAGLIAKQRAIIEEQFKIGTIKIIVATPTLAAGVDLPAFRVIIRDLKRFGVWGMDYIPVLEYEQQSGRAGRPSYDTFGEAICIASDEKTKEEIIRRYINGCPEEIYSKLAVEPIMRTTILSLISSSFVHNTEELEQFFDKTFYAFQYGDKQKLRDIIDRMLAQLVEWEFIAYDDNNSDQQQSTQQSREKERNKKSNQQLKSLSTKKTTEKMMDFVSAFKISFSKNQAVHATLLGKRVSELYLDPYTAHMIVEQLHNINTVLQEEKENNNKTPHKDHNEKTITPCTYIHLMCSCLELRPLLTVKNREVEEIVAFLNLHESEVSIDIPEPYDTAYEEFLQQIKTTAFFLEWIDEKDEEYLLEKFDVRPGEIQAKKERADWLLYSFAELSRLLNYHYLIKECAKLRMRIEYGVKEEVIALLQLKGIGRVRARILFNHRIRTLGDIKNTDITTLTQYIGKAISLDIKKQVGQDLSEGKIVVKENKRKGQINLNDFDDE